MKRLLLGILVTILGFSQVNWQIEIVDSAVSAGNDYRFNSLALDTAGNPHIVYNKIAFTQLVHASKVDSIWQKESIDSGAFYYGLSLIIDDNNNPHLSFLEKDEEIHKTFLRYARREDTGWLITAVDSMVDSLGYLFWYFNSSIDLDSESRPAIAYMTWDVVDSMQYLKYARYNGTSWDTLVVERDSVWSGFLNDFSPSLILDSQNQPHIAFYQHHYMYGYDSLKYLYYDSASSCWNAVKTIYLLLAPIDSRSSLSLALSTQDHPRLAYPYVGTLVHTWWDGAIWINDYMVDIGGSGLRIDLELDNSNNSHIMYLPEPLIGHARYCYKDSVWHLCGRIEPDTMTRTWDADVNLELDESNQPHVCYEYWLPAVGGDIFGIKYAKGTLVGIEERGNKTSLSGSSIHVFPNPFRYSVNITYRTDGILAPVDLLIFDACGSLVQKYEGITTPSNNDLYVRWTGCDNAGRRLPCGVYFLKFHVGDFCATEKVLLIR